MPPSSHHSPTSVQQCAHHNSEYPTAGVGCHLPPRPPVTIRRLLRPRRPYPSALSGPSLPVRAVAPSSSCLPLELCIAALILCLTRPSAACHGTRRAARHGPIQLSRRSPPPVLEQACICSSTCSRPSLLPVGILLCCGNSNTTCSTAW